MKISFAPPLLTCLPGVYYLAHRFTFPRPISLRVFYSNLIVRKNFNDTLTTIVRVKAARPDFPRINKFLRFDTGDGEKAKRFFLHSSRYKGSTFPFPLPPSLPDRNLSINRYTEFRAVIFLAESISCAVIIAGSCPSTRQANAISGAADGTGLNAASGV